MWIVKKSKVHGTGVFATKDIKKNVTIIEYIGEKVSKTEGDRRSAARIKKYLKYLDILSDSLNQIHNVNFSKGYWEILIGPWLLFFICISNASSLSNTLLASFKNSYFSINSSSI